MASLSLERVLSGGAVDASVLGVSSHALWFDAAGAVVAVTTRDAIRLPNGVEIASTSEAGLLESVAHGASVVVRPDALDFGGLVVDLVRWWDPRPALPCTTNEDLVVAIDGFPHSVPGLDTRPLASALSGTSSRDLVDASMTLLGRGPGLTPEGDDVLAGSLAAIRTFGMALGSSSALTMLDAAEEPLVTAANRQTTAFSAALIRSSIRGEVAAPVGGFLRALAGRGDIDVHHRDLLRVGHTSGPALAAGIVLGIGSLIAAVPTPTEVSNDCSG